jgi:hypothetical protein
MKEALPPYDLPEVKPTDIVAVFIASRNTTPPYRRVLWRMIAADAMKVCTDPRTAGKNFGLHWTAEGIDDPDLNRYVRDTGSFDQVLADHHVRVLGSWWLGHEGSAV